ncbi:MAG: TatD family hydrolase [Elusimicrobiota bacterium]|nr:TatD family hydrolase [Elusimicrobiota bacterium]
MKAIDSHAHISDKVYDADREAVINRSFESGVCAIIDIACEEKVWDKSLKLSQKEGIWTTFGIHPHEAQNAVDEDFKKLLKLLENKKAVAVGEAGLDYYYNYSPQDLQKKVFKRQIDIAAEVNKPIVIHSRNSGLDVISILKEYKRVPSGVIHSFDGSMQEAKIYIDMGFMLGVCSTITYPKAQEIRNVIADAPLSNLLIETDCPYRAPQNERGKRSEPSFVLEIAEKLAEIKNISIEEVCAATYTNAERLFLGGQK